GGRRKRHRGLVQAKAAGAGAAREIKGRFARPPLAASAALIFFLGIFIDLISYKRTILIGVRKASSFVANQPCAAAYADRRKRPTTGGRGKSRRPHRGVSSCDTSRIRSTPRRSCCRGNCSP